MVKCYMIDLLAVSTMQSYRELLADLDFSAISVAQAAEISDTGVQELQSGVAGAGMVLTTEDK